MIIDVIFLVLMLMAIVRGLRKGLILALFALAAFVIGLAAALKLSVITSVYLQDSVNVSARWLPVLSFALVFIVVVLLVKWIGMLIEKTIDLAMLGWINKIAGILLYAALYTILFSVALFYMVQLHLIKQETLQTSVTYHGIEPWGPVVVDAVGKIIPLFRDMFAALRDFFGNMAQKLA